MARRLILAGHFIFNLWPGNSITERILQSENLRKKPSKGFKPFEGLSKVFIKRKASTVGKLVAYIKDSRHHKEGNAKRREKQQNGFIVGKLAGEPQRFQTF